MKIHACDERIFSYFLHESKNLYPGLCLDWGEKKCLQRGKTEGSAVLQAPSINEFGLSWGLPLLFLCWSPEPMTCENIDRKDNILYLGFESSRSCIGFKTTVQLLFFQIILYFVLFKKWISLNNEKLAPYNSFKLLKKFFWRKPFLFIQNIFCLKTLA